MDVCHIFLGRPWPFDRKFVHDGRRNTYTLEKDGNKHTLLPLNDGGEKGTVGENVLMISGKELLREVKKEKEMHFSIVGKPKVILTSTNLDNFPVEIKNLLNDYVDIIVDELPSALPPIRSISHHIDLIPSAILPKKAAYRLTPREN